MSRAGFFVPDLKVNFRMRDFFLDFLACLVPGLIFLIGVTFLIGGLLAIFAHEFWYNIPYDSEIAQKYLIGIINSFSFHLWLSFTITFLAYFSGHLLYRQTPKRPDYASFLRIRSKVMRDKNDWVIPRGKGVTSNEIQFPYANLQNYLKLRGFKYLADLIKWDETKIGKRGSIQRSKTFINKMKIRIALFYPELTLSLIRNEAHIRLVSSMWYGSKFNIKIAYYCNFIMSAFLGWIIMDQIEIANLLSMANEHEISNIADLVTIYGDIFGFLAIFFSVIALAIGYVSRHQAKTLMEEWKNNQKEKENKEAKERKKGQKKSVEDKEKEVNEAETEASEAATKIDRGYMVFDYCPIISALWLVVGSQLLFGLYGHESGLPLKLICWYLAIQIFVLMGVIFAKHRIEETVHYQRVREVFFVLETLHLTKLSDDKNLPDLNPDRTKTKKDSEAPDDQKKRR